MRREKSEEKDETHTVPAESDNDPWRAGGRKRVQAKRIPQLRETRR